MTVIDDGVHAGASALGLEVSALLGQPGVHQAHARAGDVLFREGDSDRNGDAQLYVIDSGRVRVGRHDREGRECLFTVLGPGEVFGEESVFDPGPLTSTATAMTDVSMIAVPRPAVLAIITAHPDTAQRFLRILARRIRWTSSNIADTVYADVSARVAKHLLGLAQRFGRQDNGVLRVPMDLTQQQFAHLVGTSRESVNKALCDFVHRGWIRVGPDSIVIRQSEPLAARMHGARRPGRGTVHDATPAEA